MLTLGVFSIMPPGLPHAVFSVGMEGYKPTCVIMSGSHFISEYTMSLMLEAAISHSAWHDVWTNATHDCIIAHVDWMLHNLLLRSVNGVPSRILQDSNAFALIAYARFAPWLTSLPHQRQLQTPAWLKDFSPLDDLKNRMSQNASTQAATNRTLDILDHLARKADMCVSSFLPADLTAFMAAWEASRQKLESELQRRLDYNIDSNT
jgi:hypothetical protein